MTISVLNETLTSLASADFRVNQAYAGDVYDINSRENRFGCFVATPMTATRTDGGVITYHYVLYYIDRLTDDESNMSLVQTDAVSVLKKVIDKLCYEGVGTNEGYQFTIFKHQFDDWCAGAYVDIDFIVPDMDCEEFTIGEEVDLRPVVITANGTYIPTGFDGYDAVVVNVPGGSDVSREWVDSEIESKLEGYATEDWVDEQGYLTEHQDLSGYALKSEIPSVPTKTSELTNDSGYLTEHQQLKTINNQSLVGTGNITIEGGGVTMDEVDSEIDSKLEGYATQEWVAETAEVPASNVTCNIAGDMFDFSDVDTGLNRLVDVVEDMYGSKENKRRNFQIHYEQDRINTSDEQFLVMVAYIRSNGQDAVRVYFIDDLSGYSLLATEMYVTDDDFSILATDGKVRLEAFIDDGDIRLNNEDIVGTSSLTSYATKTWVEGKGYVKSTDIPAAENIATKDEIPTKTSDLTNDSGFLTEHQDLSDYALKSEIPAEKPSYTIEFEWDEEGNPIVTSTMVEIKEIGEYLDEHGNGSAEIYLLDTTENVNYPCVGTMVLDGEYQFRFCDGAVEYEIYVEPDASIYDDPSITRKNIAALEDMDDYATKTWVEDKGYTSNAGTVTSVAVKMNGSVKGTVTSSGTIDLGTVITSHQDISGKVDKSSIWTGTEAQWNALTAAQKASYTIALIRA